MAAVKSRRAEARGRDPRLPSPGQSGITRLSAYGVIRRDGRLLLCHYAFGTLDEWTLPGGGLEFGEGPEAAAVREVEEETGLVAVVTGHPQILSDRFVSRLDPRRPEYHAIRFVYPMEVVAGSERVEVDGTTDGFGWFDADELAALQRAGRLVDMVDRVLDPAAAADPARSGR